MMLKVVVLIVSAIALVSGMPRSRRHLQFRNPYFNRHPFRSPLNFYHQFNPAPPPSQPQTPTTTTTTTTTTTPATPPFYFQFFETTATLPTSVYSNFICNSLSDVADPADQVISSGTEYYCGFGDVDTYVAHWNLLLRLARGQDIDEDALKERSLSELKMFAGKALGYSTLPMSSPYRKIYGTVKTFLMAADSSEEYQKELLVKLLMSLKGRIEAYFPTTRYGFYYGKLFYTSCPYIQVFKDPADSILENVVELSLEQTVEAFDPSEYDVSALVDTLKSLYEDRDGVITNYDGLMADSTFEDTEAVCYLLELYADSGTTSCGIASMATAAYDKFHCSVNASQPLAPATTTTTTTTTTTQATSTTTTPTTTTPTTTTPSTTTTPTPRPTTTTSTTTTTTPAPTTTTPAPTTTSTTTTTTVAPPQCGRSPTASRLATIATAPFLITSRIVGGTSTGSCSTYPWQVKLSINGESLCGGSIIDSTHILTAAHCIPDSGYITVVAGDYDLQVAETTEQTVTADVENDVTVHARYGTNYLGAQVNDIAIIKLPEALDLSKDCVEPICLNPDFKPDGQECTISGWGTTSSGGSVSTTLQSVSLETHQGGSCDSTYSIPTANYLSQPDQQVCAGDPTGGKDSCQGDSGGPLVCLDQSTNTFVQVGVVSYGYGCARAGYPGVYSSTSAYSDWIAENL